MWVDGGILVQSVGDLEWIHRQTDIAKIQKSLQLSIACPLPYFSPLPLAFVVYSWCLYDRGPMSGSQ